MKVYEVEKLMNVGGDCWNMGDVMISGDLTSKSLIFNAAAEGRSAMRPMRLLGRSSIFSYLKITLPQWRNGAANPPRNSVTRR